MADSTLSRFKDEVAHSPAADRLKEELQNYLHARAQQAVTSLGDRIGESAGRLAEPGKGGAGGLAKSLAEGGKALGEGRSPAQAAMAAGASHAKEMLKDKVKGVFGKAGRAKSGGGKSKSVTIVEDVDVGVPVREAYDQWTQFQEFSSFAKGVVSVERSDDVSSNWKVKVAKSTRSWKANVTEQVPDRRISWTTEGAKGTVKGVVTFHRLTDDLTRVLLVLEYFPGGFFEKTGNIWRAQGRRARLDLKLYRKFIMMRGEATDGWRGEIRDGEVTVGHDEAVEEEERAGDDGRDDGEVPPAEDEYDEDGDEPGEETGDSYAEGEDEEAEAAGEFAEDDEPRDEPDEGAYDDPDGEPDDELDGEHAYESESEDPADEHEYDLEDGPEGGPEDGPEDEALDEQDPEPADEFGEPEPEEEADEHDEDTGTGRRRAAARR